MLRCAEPTKKVLGGACPRNIIGNSIAELLARTEYFFLFLTLIIWIIKSNPTRCVFGSDVQNENMTATVDGLFSSFLLISHLLFE